MKKLNPKFKNKLMVQKLNCKYSLYHFLFFCNVKSKTFGDCILGKFCNIVKKYVILEVKFRSRNDTVY